LTKQSNPQDSKYVAVKLHAEVSESKESKNGNTRSRASLHRRKCFGIKCVSIGTARNIQK